MTQCGPVLGCSSLVEVLRRRALESPGRRIYTFLDGDGQESASFTCEELDRRARTLAALLQERPAERALLLYPPGLEFIAAFFGCLYAGVTAVPAYPPRPGRDQPRLGSIAADCRAALVLTTTAIAARRRDLVAGVPELSGCRWLATDEQSADPVASWQGPEFAAAAPAFLQYTSGSTSEPKGVLVSHGNLLHNEEVIRRAFGQSESSVVVGWLPLYHDMGLIGNVLQPLWSGGHAVLMSPLTFLQSPRRWLEAIGRYGATTSGGPNFAYDLCLRKIGERGSQGLDLRTWRVAFNGAETVRYETLERFAETFAPCGFRREAFYPCYGLAEATLFVSGGLPEQPFVFRAVGAGALEENRVAAPGDLLGRNVVSCGRPAADPEQAVVVVDPESGAPCPADRVGEIWIAGPSVAAGYWGRRDETARVFGARLSTGEGPFLRTGDLGFLADGELYVTGRLKDLIIIRGRNYYPQDIELTVQRSHPLLRPGGGAAFGVDGEGEERLVVVQEVERAGSGTEELRSAIEAIRRATAESHEVAVDDVILVRRGTVPKTSSGKTRRSTCRAAYLAGALHALARSPAGDAEAPEPFGSDVDEAPLALLCEEVARLVSISPERLDPGLPLIGLGIDSLGAVELKGRLEARLGARVSLARLLGGATLAELAEELRERPTAADRLKVPGRLSSEQPLSAGQKALWFAERLAPASGIYNLASAARVHGDLDADALRRAVETLVRRHPALRTTFTVGEDGPRQRVHDALSPDFRVEGATPGLLEAALRAEAYRPSDLEHGPLVRLRLWPLSEREHALLLVVHHLVADFWSMTILARELAALYQQETTGLPAGLALPAASYLEFVRWQAELLAGPRGEELWRYWRHQLGGELPILELPADRPRPTIQSYVGSSRLLRLDRELSGRVLALAASCGATLHMVLLAGLQALLHRYTGNREVLVGSPAAGRSVAGLEDVVGYFVNPLVIRTSFDGSPSFTLLLARVRVAALEALEHQDLPFPVLVERLHPERDAGRSPIFQVMLVLQRAHGSGTGDLAAFALGEAGARTELAGLACESLPLPERRVPFDLVLMAAEVDEEIALSLQFDTELFDGASIERSLGHLARLLRGAVESSGAPVADLELLSAGEREQVDCSGAGPAVVAGELCMHELIMAQARRTPAATALVWGERRIEYAELDRRASALAARLRSLGVAPEVRVALCAERSPELLVGMLAILKAGGAYVPLDPAYPTERLALMLESSGAAVLLTQERLAERLPSSQALLCLLDTAQPVDGGAEPERWADRPLPGNLAWIIFTSGSTGTPKGVAIEHRSVAAFARWVRQVFSDEELSGVLAATSVCFDLSIFELLVPLCWGGRVVLVDDALALPSSPAAGEVRLVNTVPSAMAELVRVDGLPAAVMTVNLAGEPLTRELAQRIYGGSSVCRLLNLYGPSEDTTYSTVAVVGREDRQEPTIGRPIAGTRVHLVDAGLQRVPPGIPGEICLAGAGLARGYHGCPDLTAERFMPDPFAAEPGGRLYRTGDLARFLPSGELQFLGRIDHQVKIRGFRIELGEVEAALRACPGVRQVVALGAEDPSGGKRLVAYVVPDGESLAAAALREALRRRLPEFMVPAVALLESLPLTPTGKVDRRALARIAPGSGWSGHERTAPRTPAEGILAGIWEEVLGVQDIGIHDDFFALGGHSLLAVRAQSRIRERLQAEVPLSAFFHSPTVARLARWLTPCSGAPNMPPPRAEGQTRFPLSFAQERLWFLQRLEPSSVAYHLAGRARLEGLLDVPALRRAWTWVVQRHEVLRMRIREVDGRPFQELTSDAPGLALIELRAGTGVESYCRAAARSPLDPASRPPLRVVLLRQGEQEHLLLLTLHHLVADEESLELLVRELTAGYETFSRGGEPLLPELPFQYGDFAAWQRAAPQEEVVESRLRWWEERLAGLAPLELQADRPRPPARSSSGGVVAARLDAAVSTAVAALARREASTPFIALLAAFEALLCRYTTQLDFGVGCPVTGRDRRELERLVGLFVNTLVLRAELSGDPGFRQLLRRVRSATLAAHEHGDVPFELVVERLRPERSLDRSPLFSVTFALYRPPRRRRAGALEVTVEAVETGTAKFDLSLFAAATEDGIVLSLEHAADLFDTTTAARMLGHLSTLIAGAAADPDLPLSELPLLSAEELRQVIIERNRTEMPSAIGLVHELFERQARSRSDHLAVSCGAERLTYGELERLANRWAHRLIGRGVRSEVPVALWLDHSTSFVAAALAVLKAGGAYVPIDPESPPARLDAVLEQAGVRVLVTDGRRAGRVGFSGEVLLVDGPAAETAREDPTAVRVDGRNLAYVVLTSGSTGSPKAVAVEHASLANLAQWHLRTYEVSANDRATQIAAVGFDAAVWEIWPYLVAGASLHIPDEAIRSSPAALVDWMAAQRVTLCFLPTPLAEIAVARPRPTAIALRALLTGGDRLRRRPAAGWNLVNHYGPTECTVVATSGPVPAPDEPSTESPKGAPPPIGRAIGNVRAYVLDLHAKPQPAGVPGELYLGGCGLARGYLGQPDLTAERFVPDSLSGEAGARLYRTGDLVRWRGDGDLDFLGRADLQLKIQGFRIEPAEVESALCRHPSVQESVVHAWESVPGRPVLVAYVVPHREARPTPADLREFLRARLPGYMVPATFMTLPALPLTPHGKVDRRALPRPERDLSQVGFTPARNDVEARLAGIWSEVLGVGPVGVHDDFFELGGRSLVAMEILARVRSAFGVELPLRSLFESATVAELAHALEQAAPDAAPAIVPLQRDLYRAAVSRLQPHAGGAGHD